MYIWILGALLVLGALAYSYIGTHPEGVLDGEHEGDVRALVQSFSNQLDTVLLLEPDAAETIKSVYAPYVANALIEAWAADPLNAPGRLTSSPSPDYIHIVSVKKLDTGIYEVAGEVVMVTSTGEAGRIPVSIIVETIEGRLLITRYVESETGEVVELEGVSVIAKLNERVEAWSVSVTPTEILEDSRCPTDVQCIQAGTVRVQTTVTDGLGTSTPEFTLGTTITTEAFTVTLVDVAPAKVSTTPVTDADYRFTFRIEHR
ncbi:hypothetical protein KKD95_03070 [Patescibacteria group bacterium]|nr:hypothetical protein [Patescibacteria group bacterium]